MLKDIKTLSKKLISSADRYYNIPFIGYLSYDLQKELIHIIQTAPSLLEEILSNGSGIDNFNQNNTPLNNYTEQLRNSLSNEEINHKKATIEPGSKSKPKAKKPLFKSAISYVYNTLKDLKEKNTTQFMNINLGIHFSIFSTTSSIIFGLSYLFSAFNFHFINLMLISVTLSGIVSAFVEFFPSLTWIENHIVYNPFQIGRFNHERTAKAIDFLTQKSHKDCNHHVESYKKSFASPKIDINTSKKP